MDVKELSRDQLIELKQNFICEENEAAGRGTYWGELVCADDLVADETIFAYCEGTVFTDDDFCCTAA